jgi:hypothetical protein
VDAIGDGFEPMFEELPDGLAICFIDELHVLGKRSLGSTCNSA